MLLLLLLSGRWNELELTARHPCLVRSKLTRLGRKRTASFVVVVVVVVVVAADES